MVQILMRASLGSMLYCLLATNLFAQSFFSSTTGTNFNSNAGSSVPKAQPSPVLTPSEYQSQVNSMHQQTIENAQSKFQQQYKTVDSPAFTKNASATPTVPEQSASSYSAPPVNMPTTTPPPMNTATGASAPSQPGATVAPSAPSTVAPSAPRTNTYTGFGSGTNSNNPQSAPAPANNTTGGGWNIKY